MRLVSCYIENFGGLSGYTIEFSPGITVIKEPNGFGKTTLAEFIRAMFYGFPRAGKALEKNIRKKYFPWQGGRYGGSLIFEFEKKIYRIERTFGQSPREDTFDLYDTDSNRKSRRFSEKIGLELFGLDSESFERSTYMPQLHEHSSLTTDSIRSKLSDLVEDTNDVNNFDKAFEALRAKRSELVPFRGTGGTVAAVQRKISELEINLSKSGAYVKELEELQQTAAELKTYQIQLKQKSDELRSKSIMASEASANRALFEQYQKLSKEYNESKEAHSTILNRYHGTMPASSEIDALSAAFDRAASLSRENTMSQTEISARKILSENNVRFADGLPSQEQLDICQQQCRNFFKIYSERENTCLSKSDEEHYKELAEFFSVGVPDDAFISKCQEYKNKIERLTGRLEQAKLTIDEKSHAARSGRAFNFVLSAGIFSATSGIILTLFKSYASGGVLIGLGIIFLIGAVYLRLRQKQRELIAKHKVLQRSLSECLAPYFKGDIPDNAVMLLQNKRIQYKRLLQQQKENKAKAERLDGQLYALTAKITAFLTLYFETAAPENFSELTLKLQRECDRYRQAKELVEERAALSAKRVIELKQCEESVKLFSTRYGLPLALGDRTALLAVRDELRTYKELTGHIENLRVQIDNFKKDHPAALTSAAAPAPPDIEILKSGEKSLNAELSIVSQKILSQNQKIKSLQEQADKIPLITDELEDLKEKRTAGLKNCGLLDQTMDFLQKAKEQLSCRYLSEVQKNFDSYIRRITNDLDEHIFLNTDLEVQIERSGMLREIGYFSVGQTDIIMLCMRLSLADALFKKNKPIIILDDPFVNLDDIHTQKALELLQSLARNHQILYLVCNSSRS